MTPDRLQGRVYSAGGFIANGVEPLASTLAGLLVGSLGGWAATIVAAAFVAASLAPLVASPAVRGLGRPDTWPDGGLGDVA